MNLIESPISIHELAFLQAYLYGIFTIEKQCKKNFNNTEWYLNEKYSQDNVNALKSYFLNNDIECDCDIINKLDLKKLSKDVIKTHDD